MTMEVILSTAFGRAVDVQGGKGGKLYECAKSLMSNLTKRGLQMQLIQAVQFVVRKFVWLKQDACDSSWCCVR